MRRLSTITIPTNRVKNVLDVSAPSAGSDSVIVNVEDDGVILTAYASSLQAGAQVYINVESIGDGISNLEQLGEFPLILNSGIPYMLKINVAGNIQITATYTGQASFEIRGKAVSGSAIDSEAMPVKLELTDEDRQQQRDMVILLSKNNDLLTKILNHHRLITGIEGEIGEEF